MHFLSPALFVISANIDSFAVGVAYGIKKIKIGILSSVLISVISAAGTFFSMTFGLVIRKCMPVYLSNAFGSIILIAIGVWVIAEDYLKKRITKTQNTYQKKERNEYLDLLEHPENADADRSGTIDVKECITLAFALTINNIGLGIGASITGLNILLNTLLTFLFNLFAILLGCRLGNSCFADALGKYATAISGIIIIGLGFYEFFI